MANFQIFQDSTKDVERLISKERYETVSSLDAGIERMAREKYAFLWTRETMDYLLAKNCTFTTLKGNTIARMSKNFLKHEIECPQNPLY